MTLPEVVQDAMADISGEAKCRCSVEYTERGMKDPACNHDMMESVEIIRAHLLSQDAQVEQLERDNARLDASESQLIDERDHAQDALQKTHIELGGDGEWTCKMGAAAEPPPDSGDLHDDVPQLAAEVRARADLAESRLAAANALLRECLRYLNPQRYPYTIKRIDAHLQGAGDEA